MEKQCEGDHKLWSGKNLE